MKKKLVVTTLTLAAVAMLAACGNKNETNQEPTKAPEVVTTAPTQDPNVDYSAQVEELYSAIEKAYGDDQWQMKMRMEGEEAFMEENLGLKKEWYDAAAVGIPMMSASVDTVFLIHPTEGNLENVQKALETYQNNLKADLMQYPMNLTKIQASSLETIGGYVCFFQLGFVDEMYEEDAEYIAAYQKLNVIASDAVKSVLGK